MTSEDLKRRLAAILSADVVGYSLLMRDDEAATVRTLNACKEAMNLLICQHHGRVVDSPGDNLLAEFASVVDAVQGAVAIQKELKALNAKLADNRKMAFRIGINLGDVIVEGDRIFGDGVNIAARLQDLADPGGICISRTAYDQIEDKLPLGYEYMGERMVKNIPKPVRAYKVLLEPEEAKAKGPARDLKGWDKAERFRRVREGLGRHTQKQLSKARFYRHLRAYVGVIGFLLIINLLTDHDRLWFYWPALGWGLLLFLHWNRVLSSARFADRNPGISTRQGPGEVPGARPRYLRIRIEPKDGAEERRVNIRIPASLLRRGAKLGSALPRHAKERLEEAFRAKGFDVDLSSVDHDKLRALLASLGEMELEVDKDDKMVRIFYE
jgi:adenylate cyclase